MSTNSAVRFVAPEHTDDQQWKAWLAKGKALDRLANRRLVFVVASVACGLISGVLISFVLR